MPTWLHERGCVASDYPKKDPIMDRSTSGGGTTSFTNQTNPMSSSLADSKVEGTARTAHQTVNKAAGKAASQVNDLSETAHRVVDSAADSATSAAEWASNIPAQAGRLTNAAAESIRAHPLATAAGALFIGYLMGRLARL